MRRIAVLALCLIPLTACAPDTEEEAAPPAEELQPAQPEAPAALTDASEDYIEAWNGTDMAAASAFFLDDATATVNDSTWTGRQQIEQHWLTPHQAAVTDLQATTTKVEQRGAEWYTEGTYTHKYKAPDAAEAMDVTGHFMTTWAQAPDGQWRIRSTHIMQDQPADATKPAPQN